MTEVPAGRRERKKALTRQNIADAALALFRERGFDRVSVREVAEAADVSMSGLFQHFPSKESLVFGREEDQRDGLVAAVRDRPEGTDVLTALRAWLLAQPMYAGTGDAERRAVLDLVSGTASLREHAALMWTAREEALAAAVAEAGPEVPGAGVAARALSRFVLDRAVPWDGDAPLGAVEATFALLAEGWENRHTEPARPSRAAVPGPDTAEPGPPGLRERKKAATRRSLAETARRLFAERGFEDVGVREVAEEAGTSVATLFSYYPDGKVSLVFGEEKQVAELVAAVRDRPGDRTVLDALRGFLIDRCPGEVDPSPLVRELAQMVRETPELRAYRRRLWTSGQAELAGAVAAAAGLEPGDVEAGTLARCVLQIPDLTFAEQDPRAAVDMVFGLLRVGWPACLEAPHGR
ncbi:HTH-type transcriptional repressor AcnR [Actinomadura rubteroloni]|uniref:HTH-type transcriptional repressor AcnR n=1 Tax=Actinomadura rubteroloni TaxID=1926885 RepID=A0A2P4UIP1_9ACTN|nr:TetR/AcrR family transcriptional regulator [Actinomadura rubteroloni]POM24929.1 HTH-type transcriptional repressor AcnR [Actinomadura rubteroloni]